MTKGDMVSIYKNWYTETNLEGEAVLLEKMEEDDVSEEWVVRFKGDSDKDVISRRILKPKR